MKKGIYLKLFKSTFYISAFTFGGGFVIVPLMKKRFVEDLKWIDEKEMLDLIAIAQTSPGAIAVNTSILIGYKTAGFVGALFTLLGTVLPPFIILSVISLFYTAFRDNVIVGVLLKGMQAGVAAVIAEIVTGMGGQIVRGRKAVPIVIMALAFFAAFVLKINVIYIIIVCAVIGAAPPVYRSYIKKQEGCD